MLLMVFRLTWPLHTGPEACLFKPSPQQKVQIQKLRLGELIAFMQGSRLIM